jgi:hypothetical protein
MAKLCFVQTCKLSIFPSFLLESDQFDSQTRWFASHYSFRYVPIKLQTNGLSMRRPSYAYLNAWHSFTNVRHLLLKKSSATFVSRLKFTQSSRIHILNKTASALYDLCKANLSQVAFFVTSHTFLRALNLFSLTLAYGFIICILTLMGILHESWSRTSFSIIDPRVQLKTFSSELEIGRKALDGFGSIPLRGS